MGLNVLLSLFLYFMNNKSNVCRIQVDAGVVMAKRLKTKLVQSAEEAISNIKEFQRELAASPELQARAAYSRAWYAHQGDNGTWLFGPSKFIGYNGMTAKEYVGPNEDRDGRKTEDRLQDWFDEVTDPTLDRELKLALGSFLATYGKAPSRKFRINVLSEESANESAQSAQRTIVDLLVAVSRTLAPEQLRLLKRKLQTVIPAK